METAINLRYSNTVTVTGWGLVATQLQGSFRCCTGIGDFSCRCAVLAVRDYYHGELLILWVDEGYFKATDYLWTVSGGKILKVNTLYPVEEWLLEGEVERRVRWKASILRMKSARAGDADRT